MKYWYTRAANSVDTHCTTRHFIPRCFMSVRSGQCCHYTLKLIYVVSKCFCCSCSIRNLSLHTGLCNVETWTFLRAKFCMLLSSKILPFYTCVVLRFHYFTVLWNWREKVMAFVYPCVSTRFKIEEFLGFSFYHMRTRRLNVALNSFLPCSSSDTHHEMLLGW